MTQSGRERLSVMVYQRVLKLPCDDIRSGIGFKATLDTALKQLVEGLFKASDGFKIDFGDHTGGHLRAVIRGGGQTFEVEGCYGQNSSFTDGKKERFVSYTVRAESAVGESGQANASETAELIGKISGVVLAVALASALMSPILKSSKFLYCLPVLAIAAFAGKWLGLRAVRVLSRATQSRNARPAEDRQQQGSANEPTQAKAAWKRLIHAIESVTSDYPTA